MSAAELPREIARQLLERAGCLGEFNLTAIPGGRNNRVWRIRANESDFLLKQYYWTESDRRDRMGHEWDFLTYLHSIGCTGAAKAIAADREHRFALIEFIEGAPPKLSEVTEAEISAASNFYAEMNAGRFSDAGRALPAASEACFSLEEHIETTARRVRRVEQIERETNREAHEFVAEELSPLWHRVHARIVMMAPDAGGL